MRPIQDTSWSTYIITAPSLASKERPSSQAALPLSSYMRSSEAHEDVICFHAYSPHMPSTHNSFTHVGRPRGHGTHQGPCTNDRLDSRHLTKNGYELLPSHPRPELQISPAHPPLLLRVVLDLPPIPVNFSHAQLLSHRRREIIDMHRRDPGVPVQNVLSGEADQQIVAGRREPSRPRRQWVLCV